MSFFSFHCGRRVNVRQAFPLTARPPHNRLRCLRLGLRNLLGATGRRYVAPTVPIDPKGYNCAIASAQCCVMRACSHLRVCHISIQNWYVALA